MNPIILEKWKTTYLNIHKNLDGFDKFIEYKIKKPNVSNSKEYLKLLYGELWETYHKKININRITPYDREWWINKGYDEENVNDLIKKYKTDKSTSKENFIKRHGNEGLAKFKKFQETSKHTLKKYILKYGDKLGNEKWLSYIKTKDTCSFSWALEKSNGDFDAAISLISIRREKCAINKSKYIEKYGEDEWKLLLESRRIDFKWALRKCNGVYSDAVDLYSSILSKRMANGFVSKESVKLLSKFKDRLLLQNFKVWFNENEYFLYDKQEDRSYAYDFCAINKNNKIIIEYHGTRYHPKDKNDDTGFAFLKSKKDIRNKWEYDQRKIRLSKDLGFNVLVIWSDDNNKNEKINKFINENTKNN